MPITIVFPQHLANGALGGVKLGYTQTGKNYPVKLSSSQAYVTVPWTDTIYSLPIATSATGGVKLTLQNQTDSTQSN